jgi:hypothetical protein
MTDRKFVVTVEFEVWAADESDARFMVESDDWTTKTILRVDDTGVSDD